MRIKVLLLCLASATILTACSDSSSSSSSSSSTNVVATALSQLKTAVPDVSDGVAFASLSVSDQDSISPFGVALTTHMSKANFMYPGDNGGAEVTPLAFLEALLSDSTSGPDDAVFKRANMAFLIACAIDTLAVRGGTLYTTSQTAMTMNATTVQAVCGTFPELNSMNGKVISFTVEDLADTTNYDQKISMLAASGTNGTTFGATTNQYMYVRNNASVLSFLHLEVNTGSNQATANYLHFDKTASSGRFQYASINGTSNKHLYRIHVDTSANTTSLLTFNVASATKWAKVYARSTVSSQTKAAISMSWAGMSTNAGGTAALNDGNACFNVSGTTSVDSDNTLVCSTGTTLPGPASDSDTLLNTTFGLAGAGKAVANISALSTTSTGAAYAPTFTATTIPSAALGF